ncbi:phosphatase PAP2 family protein [Clostridium rectalis]|uniref:phosphatase PAP2 family protein n=1 Tax=Clostridium rectalis TaxID=2040295 RepID=UPI000F63399D|nr:phosphatase PAP2 family protein [Clostridium rectalis]
MEKIKSNISHLSALISIPIINIFYGVLNNNERGAYIIATDFDKYTPFLKEFIIPYILWYPFIFFTLFYLCVKNKKVYYKTLISINIGLIVCYITYFFFQTTVPRPMLYGNDIFTKLTLIIYKLDKPFNCFPSIHVLTCYLVIKGILYDTNKPLKIIVCSISSIIILSTLFVKQHVLMDLVTAIIIGEIIFTLVDKVNWRLLYPVKME